VAAAGGDYQAQVQPNAYRIKLGLTLLAHKPSARKGVTAWEAETAKLLGVEVRQVRTYCATAKTVNAIASELAVTVLDRPLQKVVAEAKRRQAGLPSDKPPRKQRDPYREAVGAVMRLVQQVAPEQQMAWLDTFRIDTEVALAQAQGQGAAMD